MGIRSGVLAWTVAAAALLVMLAPAAASAATGYPSFLGSNSAPFGVTHLQVAPGGSEAYAIAPGYPQDAIVHYHRLPDGQLSYADCVGSPDAGGCATVPSGVSGYTGIDGLLNLAVAPDDRDLYVVSRFSQAIAHFRIGSGGTLSYVGCQGDPQYGCAPMPAREPLYDPVGLAVSPDGNDVYVLTYDAVVHLKRAGDGSLTTADCIGREPACGFLPIRRDHSQGAAGLGDPKAIGINAAGNAIYVAAGSLSSYGELTSAVVHLRRAPDGTISFADCIGANATLCRPLPAGSDAVKGAEALGISSTGANLYTSGEASPRNTLTHLAVASDGSLRFGDCLGDATAGCVPLPASVSAIAYPRSLVVSPDDQNVYVEAIGDGTLSHFQVGSGGELAFASCTSWSQVNCYVGPGGGSDDDSVAVSPDGRNVYNIDGGVESYAREAAPPAPSGPAPTITGMSATDIDHVNAQVWAGIDAHGERYNAAFQYGETTSYGSYTRGVSHSYQQGTSEKLSAMVNNLRPGMTYHYRLVVTAPSGTFYGPDTTFTTSYVATGYEPGVAMPADEGQIGTTSLRLLTMVTPNGYPTTYWFEYGTTTSYGSSSPSTPKSAGDDFLTRTVSQLVTGLQPGTTYHFRAAAKSSTGTVYSDDFTVKTATTSSAPAPAPSARTGAATGITDTAATVGAIANPMGHSVSVRFGYSDSLTSKPWKWLLTPSQSAGSGTADEAESVSLTGLLPGTTYYYRVVVVRSDEEVWGGLGTFTTQGSTAPPPLVSTGSASSITQTAATLNATVNPEGTATTYQFQWGPTGTYGYHAPATYVSAGSDSTAHAVSTPLSGLAPGTTYHFRIVAKSAAGTSKGTDQRFTTPP